MKISDKDIRTWVWLDMNFSRHRKGRQLGFVLCWGTDFWLASI